jgi:hypothetical protein
MFLRDRFYRLQVLERTTLSRYLANQAIDVATNAGQVSCVSYARWLTAIARLTLFHLWSVLSRREQVSRCHLRFVVERQPESLRQQSLQHFQTLFLRRLSLAPGLDIVTHSVNPAQVRHLQGLRAG